MKVWQYYNQHTLPAKEMGYDDEKRLQTEFNDPRIKLRWNRLARQCEVWYEPSKSNPYCVYAIEHRYNICRAIRHLRDVDRARGTELEKYVAYENQREKATQEKIHEISAQLADGMMMDYKGRTSVVV